MSRLQPNRKALATSNVSSLSATASKEPLSRPQTPISRQNTRPLSSDPVSERATLSLIRRTLCSQLGDKGRSTPAPIDELLPPLTSSNEVDLQLYAFIAIIIREFVYTWYAKITPDQIFVEEVVKIIAHCTRALEQSLRKVDLESLLFDEFPDLLEVHLQGSFMNRAFVDILGRLTNQSLPSFTQLFMSFAMPNKPSTDISFAIALSSTITGA